MGNNSPCVHREPSKPNDPGVVNHPDPKKVRSKHSIVKPAPNIESLLK